MQPAGNLNRRARFERRIAPPTGSRGQATSDWVLVANVSCQIRALGGTEAEIARQRVPTATHEIRIRYPRSWYPTPADRIVDDIGTTHHVGHVYDPDGMRHDLIVLVSNVVAQQQGAA